LATAQNVKMKFNQHPIWYHSFSVLSTAILVTILLTTFTMYEKAI